MPPAVKRATGPCRAIVFFALWTSFAQDLDAVETASIPV